MPARLFEAIRSYEYKQNNLDTGWTEYLDYISSIKIVTFILSTILVILSSTNTLGSTEGKGNVDNLQYNAILKGFSFPIIQDKHLKWGFFEHNGGLLLLLLDLGIS